MIDFQELSAISYTKRVMQLILIVFSGLTRMRNVLERPW
jgi:hypothetical protein